MTREANAKANGYPDPLLRQLLEFERAVQDNDLTGAVLKSLYERGAPIYSVGFALPSTFRFTEFLQCFVSEPIAASWELWEATIATGGVATGGVANGGSATLIQGRSCEVWRRQQDGAWKMAYDHASIAVELELAVRATADVRGLGGRKP